MKICIAGKNNIAVDALEYLAGMEGIDCSDLMIIPNECVLEYDTWQKSLIKAALKHNIPIVTLEDLYNIEDLIFISLQYEKIIKPQKFLSKKLYNMHFAPLPKYKGMYTSILPLINGETSSGVTIHEIDEGIDTGSIISQKLFPIDLQDTERDLYFKYLEYGAMLFRETIPLLLTGKYKSTAQKNIGSTIHYGSDLNYKEGSIDLKRTSFEIHNRIRAFIFEEFQLPEVNGYRIYKSILTEERKGARLFQPNDSYIEITGIDGYVIKAYYRKDNL